jgi:hypothetical protein
MAMVRRVVSSAIVAFSALVAWSCAGGASSGGTSGDPTACPAKEPAARGRCSLPLNLSCPYDVPATRTVHCGCYKGEWGCGTPLGIDIAAPADQCPAKKPDDNTRCTLPDRDSANNQPGCFYEVSAKMRDECVCAYESKGHGEWDCGQIGIGGPPRTTPCPERQPHEDTLCAPLELNCQYGYNLSTNCSCKGEGDDAKWACVTRPEPPSPGAPPQ